MRTETIAYTEGQTQLDAFVAFPEGEGPHPAVLVCHTWGGRSPFEEGKAVMLAELGYVGVAIDLYGVGRRGTDRASSAALMTPLVEDPPTLRRRLAAAVEAAQRLDGVDSTKLGAIGFCFGGLCALELARSGAPLAGVVSFHGNLSVLGGEAPTPIVAKILVCHGQDDPMAPLEMVQGFVQEMHAAGADYRLHTYPKVMHAFTNPDANAPELGLLDDANADEASRQAMERFLSDVFA